MLYAIHDALVRPYPGQKMGPSLAKSWQESPDGKTYEFKLRPGLKFHNGDPVTTEDVKFSFDRYRGASATVLKEHVAQVEIVDPLVVRFQLEGPVAPEEMKTKVDEPRTSIVEKLAELEEDPKWGSEEEREDLADALEELSDQATVMRDLLREEE